ncbi:hypothetical protein Tco_1077302, partial [Tanacetum coccineum]
MDKLMFIIVRKSQAVSRINLCTSTLIDEELLLDFRFMDPIGDEMTLGEIEKDLDFGSEFGSLFLDSFGPFDGFGNADDFNLSGFDEKMSIKVSLILSQFWECSLYHVFENVDAIVSGLRLDASRRSGRVSGGWWLVVIIQWWWDRAVVTGDGEWGVVNGDGEGGIVSGGWWLAVIIQWWWDRAVVTGDCEGGS